MVVLLEMEIWDPGGVVGVLVVLLKMETGILVVWPAGGGFAGDEKNVGKDWRFSSRRIMHFSGKSGGLRTFALFC